MLSSKGLQAARRSGQTIRNTTAGLFARHLLISTPQIVRVLSGGGDLKAIQEEANIKEEEVDEEISSKGTFKKKKSWRSKQSESWVPAAYRGIEAESKRKRKWDLSSRKEDDKVNEVKHEKAVRLVSLYKTILRSAPKYRNAFMSNPKEEAELTFTSRSLLRPGFSERMQKEIKAALLDIHSIDSDVLDWAKIEGTDKAFRSLCWPMQHLCTTCTSLSRYYDENQDQYVDLAEFLLLELVQLGYDRGKLAEAAMRTKPVEEQKRTTAVEGGKRTTSAEDQTILAEKEKSAADAEEETPRKKGIIAGWFNSMVDTISPILPFYKKEKAVVEEKKVDDEVEKAAEKLKEESTSLAQKILQVTGSGEDASEKSKGESTPLAHEQPYLESTHLLFRHVVSSIATAAKAVDSDDNDEDKEDGDTKFDEDSKLDDDAILMPQTGHKNNDARRKACEAAARRLMALLDRMPVEWKSSPDPVALHFMMETFCRAGYLEGARTCLQLFYLSPKKLKCSLVLKAYLEAARFERNEEKRQEIVNEAVKVLHQLWDLGLSSRRVERIMHCSIILNCISVAGMANARGMCHAAEGLVKRAIGGASYSQFLSELEAERPNIDVQALPMVNYLTQIYASSGYKFDISKQMLNYMMHYGNDRRRQVISFPGVDTHNAILLALSKRYEDKLDSYNAILLAASKHHEDELANKSSNAKADLDYAMNLIDFMCGRGRSDPDSLPDVTTQKLMFRLLDAVHPQNAGDIAEELLSKMEIARHFSQQKTSSVTRSTYHRIMGYWLQMAKSQPSEDAGRSPCERALRLLDKMEVQSTPMILSDKALKLVEIQNLYDVSLRPLRRTYGLVLTICAETVNPNDKAKAFDVAVEVHRRMKKMGFATGDDLAGLLTKICSFLPEASEKRKKFEETLRAEASEDDDMMSA